MSEHSSFAIAQAATKKTGLADIENNFKQQEHEEMRLWLRMLSCCNLIENTLRSKIRAEFQTTLPRYDLMSQLAANSKGLKMSDLSRLMMVTNGNITGITDQLEKDGLVERIRDEADRRSSIIKLTAKGKRYQKRLKRAHDAWIASILGGLEPSSRYALFELLGDLKQVTHDKLAIN